MKTKTNLMIALTLMGVSANAQLTNEHIDIGIGYEGGIWDLHVHDDDNGVEYAADAVILPVLNEADPLGARVPTPSGPQWSFLGATAPDVWILPQTQNPNILWPGIATEEISFGVFDNNRVFLDLVGFGGPGNFSLFSLSSFGVPTPIFTTSNGLNNADSLILGVGGHSHFNYAFTAIGVYDLTFQARGLINGVQTVSDPTTFTFEVAPVPEPATLAVLGLGAAAFLRKRRKV